MIPRHPVRLNVEEAGKEEPSGDSIKPLAPPRRLRRTTIFHIRTRRRRQERRPRRTVEPMMQSRLCSKASIRPRLPGPWLSGLRLPGFPLLLVWLLLHPSRTRTSAFLSNAAALKKPSYAAASTLLHVIDSSSPSLQQQRKQKQRYQRKEIPETEQRLRETRLERQKQFDALQKGPANLWQFENLFPAPVVDEESVLKDLYRQADGRDGTTDERRQRQEQLAAAAAEKKRQLAAVAQQPGPRPSQPPWGISILQKHFLRFLAGVNNSTLIADDYLAVDDAAKTTDRVDRQLTRLVQDRVYGVRRLPTGELQYDTSLLQDSDQAAVQFRQGVRLSNPLRINADLLTYWGRRELAHGRVEEAAELYQKAAQIDPRDGRAYLGLSKCASRRRDLALAKKWLTIGIARSVSVDEITDTPDRGANPYLLQALGCVEEEMGCLGAAESCYKEAARSRPTHAAAWVALAQLRTRKLGASARVGRSCFQRAERELKLTGKPPSSFVYTAWAKLEWHEGSDLMLARKLFQKALAVDPKCSSAWMQLGMLESQDGNWDASIQAFEQALQNDPRNARVLQAYALVETKRPGGDSREAIDLFERALAANPRDAGVLQAYALYVAELGDIDAARDLLRQGTELNKRHAAVWQAWGVLETRYGEPHVARDIFQQGIWACGQWAGNQSGGYDCARLWQAWGVLEANEGDAAAARRCFSRALDADGRNVPAFVAWALLEEKIGKVEDARIIFEKALACFSPGSDEKNNLWRTYELMEQRQANVGAAQTVFQRAMRERMALANDDTQFDEEMEAISKAMAVDGVPPALSSDETTDASSPTTKAVEVDQKPEFEVVRWKNTGGEVWMKNDRGDIEAKIGPTKKQKRLTKMIRPTSDDDE